MRLLKAPPFLDHLDGLGRSRIALGDLGPELEGRLLVLLLTGLLDLGVTWHEEAVQGVLKRQQAVLHYSLAVKAGIGEISLGV